MKKVSVIIPCYNIENYIDRCLESVFAQTFCLNDMEVICVDDGSPDETLKKLSFWEKNYPDNLILVSLSSNCGQSSARNAGVSHASGEYIAFIDGDDWIEKDYIEKLYDTATSDDFDIVQCEYIRDKSEALSFCSDRCSDVTSPETFNISNDQIRKAILTGKVISSNAPFKLIKRSLLTANNISFYDGLKYEDISFGVLLSLYATNVCILHEKLYHYYVNPSSTVLQKNETYHVDLLSVWITLWDELSVRGMLETYRSELELEFVYSCILIFWKILVLRYDDPPYPLYRLLCSVALDHIPDIMENDYIKRGVLSEVHQLVLSSCITNILSKEDFGKMAASIKAIGL